MKVTHQDTVKRVMKLIRPYWGYIVLTILLAVISVAATLYAPVLLGKGIDFALGVENVKFAGILRIMGMLGVVIAITAVSQWFMNLATNHITYHVVKDIRTQAFEHLEYVPAKFIDATQPGEMISRIITDVEQFSDGLLLGFTQLFTGVITILGTLGFMLTVDVRIALVVVVITPISLFVAGFIAKRTFAMFQVQSETRGEMTSLVEELVGNQKVVQAFSYEKEAQTRFEEINERLRKCGISAIFFSSITNPATRFVNGLVYTGVGIFGAFSVLNGRITVGQLSCFLNYANQYTKPFNEISGVVTELQNALACARRIFDFMDFPVEIQDKKDAVILENVNGNLELDHIYFSYQPEAPLLRDICLTVQWGQRIAIVGPTGCGKTTLINLLMRFYDVDQGNIKIEGYPILDVTRNSLRSSFGMVLQDTWLRAGTIYENIAYGKPDAAKEEVIEAARQAHAHSFIMRMPNAYDTVISEDGGNLSQGQKQLLCIARVMLLRPPMLILDEATSSIDTRTEVKIQRAFQKLMEGHTSFVVAHRLSTIKEADVILVMKDGNIIEQGTHEHLLEKQGFYARLYESQFALS